MAGTLTVDTIQSDSSYASTLNVASKINFTSGMQIGGQDATFGGMRNRIINGAMVIDQRKSGAAVTDSEFNNKVKSCDFWYLALGNGGTGTTVQQVSDAPTGFSNSLKWTGRTSSVTFGSANWDAILTSIEGYNIADFGWGTSAATPITVSFWVKGSVATTMSVAVYNGTTNNGIDSGNITRCYVTTYTINNTNTWEYKTITIPGPTTGTWGSTNGIGLTLLFNLNAGSNFTTATTNAWQTVSGNGYTQTSATATNYMALGGNKTFQLTGVQVEKGSSATPFEFRNYQQELALCLRYYYFSNPSNQAKTGGAWGSMYSGSTAHLNGPLPVTMRASPTFTFGGSSNTYYISNINGASSGTPQNSASSPTIIDFEVTSLSGGAVGYPCMYNGQLSITAEF
jgi:hypothetical protein